MRKLFLLAFLPLLGLLAPSPVIVAKAADTSLPPPGGEVELPAVGLVGDFTDPRTGNDQDWNPGDPVPFEEKVELCVEAELEARESRKIEKAVRQAKFKIRDACVEEVYYLPERSLTRDRVARLATCAWVDARENLVIVSESGGGKSYLAQALGVAACRRLLSVRYVRLNDMFREINVARTEGRLYDALDEFSKPSLLIIDDFFTTPVENPANAVDLFEILEARESRGSTLIATQLEPDQWYLRINSDLCADSILNRVVEHARFLDIKGPNMREYTARLKAEREKGYWD